MSSRVLHPWGIAAIRYDLKNEMPIHYNAQGAATTFHNRRQGSQALCLHSESSNHWKKWMDFFQSLELSDRADAIRSKPWNKAEPNFYGALPAFLDRSGTIWQRLTRPKEGKAFQCLKNMFCMNCKKRFGLHFL